MDDVAVLGSTGLLAGDPALAGALGPPACFGVFTGWSVGTNLGYSSLGGGIGARSSAAVSSMTMTLGPAGEEASFSGAFAVCCSRW